MFILLLADYTSHIHYKLELETVNDDTSYKIKPLGANNRTNIQHKKY